MPPASTDVLDTVLNNFTTAISGIWGPALSGYLLPLLLGIIVLQFGLIAAEMVVARDVSMVVTHAMLGLLRVGVVWAIFVHAFDWGNAIVLTGEQLGNNISGFGLTPSGVYQSGVGIAWTVFHAHATGGWLWAPFEHLEFFILAGIILLAFLFASLIYLGTLIETALLVYVGPLVIAFTPLSWTFDILIAWGKSLLGLAFKLCLILLTLSVGVALANDWIAAANATLATFTTDMWNVLILDIEVILFAFCIWLVPGRISGLAAGAASMRLGEAVWSMAGSAGRSVGGCGYMMSGSGAGGGGSGGKGGGGGGASQGGGSQSTQAATQQLAQQVQTKLTT